LMNNGSIFGNPTTAIVVYPSASLNIVNNGNVSGIDGTAINYFATSLGGAITQSGGTIQGGILLSGLSTTLRVTGGAINGYILDQTPGNGVVGSSVGLGGIVNFDLGAGSFTTNGQITVGVVNVQSGTLVLENDIYVSGGPSGPGLTNSSTLQINGLRTLTGSFVQNASGTLVMQVSPQGSSQLKVALLPSFAGHFRTGGTATLAGTLALIYQPGTYQAHTYTLISTDRSVTGTFSNVTGVVPTPGLSQAIAYGATDVELTLSGVAAPANDTIYPATATILVLSGQQATGILLDRLGERQTSIADSTAALNGTGSARVRLAQAGNIAALGEIASAMPQALATEGAWFRGIGDFVSVSGNVAAPGFSGASGGFLAGFDGAIATDLYLGVAAGYAHSDISGPSSSSGGVDSGRVAAYGGGWWGPNLLTGTTGYAYDRISSARNLSGIGTAAQAHNGHEFSIAGQWSLPTPVTGIAGTAVVTPKIGVQFLHLTENGFKETGAGSFDLSSRGNDTDSAQPYLGLAASERFVTADGTEVTPEIRLSYNREVLSNKRVITVAAIDGTAFLVQGVRPSRDMLRAGVGVTLRARDNILLYANYDAILPTGNTSRHTVAAGLRVRF
jgi:fibronectin-binding autotransporter adhesin